jgi:hypothetical protein
MRTGKAGFAYFALVFGTGFLLGLVRVPFLVPRLGERWAELIEMPLMLAVIVLSARCIVRRFALPAARPARLATGGLALALLLAAELGVALIVQDRPLADHVASRDPVSGTAYLIMLGVFALMPALVSGSGCRPSPA